jgi:hypothetical protein
MMAGCLHGAGYFMGHNMMPPNEQNPKGYYESFEIESINEGLLAQVCPRRPSGPLGRLLFSKRPRRPQRWLCEAPLDAHFRTAPELERRMEQQLSHAPYCFKDPRFCYTLPAWRPFLEDPVYLVVFREPGRTVNSILNTVESEPYLKDLRIDAAGALRVWTAQYRHILERHAGEGVWLFVHYDQVLDGSAASRLDTLLGARTDIGFPERRLKRSGNDIAVSAEAKAIYAALCERAGYRSEGDEP